jgi:hypothetical protein
MAKKNLKERLRERQKSLKSKGNGKVLFQKADEELRVRLLSAGEEQEFIKEVVQFYLGGDIKGVYSPMTFDEPCAIYEKYEELKKSKDPDDKELAKDLSPKKKYMAAVLVCNDGKGKEYDPEPKLIQLAQSQYSEIIDLYLDEEEWGDMTDLDEGYDLKLKRTGSGKNDTEYTVKPCQKKAIPKNCRPKEDIDIEALVKEVIPTYEKTQEYIEQYLGGKEESEDTEEEDDDMGSKKKDKKEKATLKKAKKSKKHKSKSEDDDE